MGGRNHLFLCGYAYGSLLFGFYFGQIVHSQGRYCRDQNAATFSLRSAQHRIVKDGHPFLLRFYDIEGQELPKLDYDDYFKMAENFLRSPHTGAEATIAEMYLMANLQNLRFDAVHLGSRHLYNQNNDQKGDQSSDQQRVEYLKDEAAAMGGILIPESLHETRGRYFFRAENPFRSSAHPTAENLASNDWLVTGTADVFITRGIVDRGRDGFMEVRTVHFESPESGAANWVMQRHPTALGEQPRRIKPNLPTYASETRSYQGTQSTTANNEKLWIQRAHKFVADQFSFIREDSPLHSFKTQVGKILGDQNPANWRLFVQPLYDLPLPSPSIELSNLYNAHQGSTGVAPNQKRERGYRVFFGHENHEIPVATLDLKLESAYSFSSQGTVNASDPRTTEFGSFQIVDRNLEYRVPSAQ